MKIKKYILNYAQCEIFFLNKNNKYIYIFFKPYVWILLTIYLIFFFNLNFYLTLK